MARLIDLRLRSGTAAAWTSANPVLNRGEPGFEYDTGMFKIGDGTTAWASLTYAAIQTSAGDTRYVLASSKGAASGVATLDSGGKLTAAQLPSLRIVETLTVANQAARLALAQSDDAIFAVQTDTSETYMIGGGVNPSVNANWTKLPAPSTAGLEQTANKDVANGYAGLDGSGLLKTAEFPVVSGGTP